MKGLFITFEGIDGAGKTTQINELVKHLKQQSLECITTREPGGTKVGEKLRKILKEEKLNPKNEIMLLYANRLDHIDKLIIPNLKEGKIVISDRFDDSTIAYQHYGRGIPLEDLEKIRNFTIGSFVPDITFLLDLKIGERKNRLKNRKLDIIEKENQKFYKKVYDGYREIANNSKRIIVIDASKKQKEISRIIIKEVEKRLK